MSMDLDKTADFSVGNRRIPSFWHSFWTCKGILKDLFPLLHLVSYLQIVFVAHMGGWNNGVWVWGVFGIPRNFVNNPILMSNFSAKMLQE